MPYLGSPTASAQLAHLAGARRRPAGDRRRARDGGAPNGFDVDTDRSTIVRQRYTRWWRSSNACMSRAPGGWTRVTPVGSDHVVVRAGLRPGIGPDCTRAVAAK